MIGERRSATIGITATSSSPAARRRACRSAQGADRFLPRIGTRQAGERRGARPRGQPPARGPAGAADQGSLLARRAVPCDRAPPGDPRGGGGAARPRPALSPQQDQHQGGGLWRGGGMAPGLGLLPAQQRQRARGRHRHRRVRRGERPDAGAAGQPSRAGARPSRRWPFLRRHRPGSPPGSIAAARSRCSRRPAASPCTMCGWSMAPASTARCGRAGSS